MAWSCLRGPRLLRTMQDYEANDDQEDYENDEDCKNYKDYEDQNSYVDVDNEGYSAMSNFLPGEVRTTQQAHWSHMAIQY